MQNFYFTRFVQRSPNLPDIIIFQLVRLPLLGAFLKMAKKISIIVWGELFVELISPVGLDLSCFCHLKTEKCALKVPSKSHTRTHTRTHIQIFVDSPTRMIRSYHNQTKETKMECYATHLGLWGRVRNCKNL